ncbi:MAG TPA: hypothetical protein DCS24_06795 [Erythrobacter sp.]|nr:hypothetical protein [Erythrobacter sp.]
MLLGACLIVGALLSFWFRDLPSSLFAWRADKPIRSLLVSVPFVLVGAFIAYVGLESAYSSAFLGTPALIVALYLIEATRSVLVGRGPV